MKLVCTKIELASLGVFTKFAAHSTNCSHLSLSFNGLFFVVFIFLKWSSSSWWTFIVFRRRYNFSNGNFVIQFPLRPWIIGHHAPFRLTFILHTPIRKKCKFLRKKANGHTKHTFQTNENVAHEKVKMYRKNGDDDGDEKWIVEKGCSPAIQWTKYDRKVCILIVRRQFPADHFAYKVLKRRKKNEEESLCWSERREKRNGENNEFIMLIHIKFRWNWVFDLTSYFPGTWTPLDKWHIRC